MRLLRTLLLTLVLFASAGSAYAAEIVDPQAIDISVHDDQAGTILLVSGQLDEKAKLPADIELAMPKGVQIQWAGEILGGPASEDIEAKYTKRTVGDHDVYRLTLTKSRIAQIEALAPMILSKSAAGVSADLSWTPVVDVGSLRMSVRMPQSARIVTPAEGAETFPGPTGYSFYSKEYTDVEAGKPVRLAFAFEIPAPAPQSAGSGSGANSLVPMILLVAVFAFGAAVVVGVRRKMDAKGADDEVAPMAAPQRALEADEDSAPELAEDGEDTDDTEEPEGPVTSSTSAKQRALLIVGALVVVFVAGMFFVSNLGSQARSLGGEVVKVYKQGDACTAATLPLALPKDEEKASQQIFSALESVPVIKATLNAETKTLKVDFCDSETNEGAVRAALQPLGVLAE